MALAPRLSWVACAALIRGDRSVPSQSLDRSRHSLTLDSKEFIATVSRAQESFLGWDEYSTMPTPPGASAREVWTALRTIHRAIGVEVSFADGAQDAHWYYHTHEIADALSVVFGHTMTNSGLFQRASDAHNAEVMVRYQVDEAIAAAELDGIAISRKSARTVPALQRAPKSATDRLLYNSLALVRDLPDYLEAPFSERLFWHFHERLTEGVSVESLEWSEPFQSLIHVEFASATGGAESAKDVRRVLESIATSLNGTNCDPHINPIIAALLAPEAFRALRPLPSMNDQVGRFVLRLAALRAGVPVLGMLPLSRAKVRWLSAPTESEFLLSPPQHYQSVHPEDADDLTGLVTATLRLTLEALIDLSGALEAQAERDEALRTLLQSDPELNHRQRSILGRALRDPEAEFRISYHRDTHNVVYATARADLLELVDRGYLKMSERGRAFVFTPRANLHAYIETMQGQNMETSPTPRRSGGRRS